MLKLTVVTAVALLAVSCASSGTPARSDSGHTTRNRTVLLQDEIKASSARDAYHAVQLLRPEWLRSRGAASMQSTQPETAIVYVDGQKYGGPSSLEQFRMGTFKEMRYYSGSEATSRWGTGHAAGVIYLTTR